MFRSPRMVRRFVLPLAMALAFSVFTTFLRAEQQKTDKNTGTVTLTVQLAPATAADQNQTAKENDKPQRDSDAAQLKQLQKAVAEVQKKMAEAQAQMDAAKRQMDAAQKQMDDAQKQMDAARKELLAIRNPLSAVPATGRMAIRGFPLLTLRSRAAASGNNAVEEARKAYEKQKKAEQERLKSDPKWQTSHEPGAVINVFDGRKGPTINSFCMNSESNLLVCCGGKRQVYPTDSQQNGGAPTVITEPREIRVISPEGNKLDVWKLQSEPQVICMGEDGTALVGGAGKLLKLDKDGKVLLTADVPNAAELPEPALEPEKKGELDADAEAAKKAREEKIAELQKKVNELRDEYTKVAQEARKDLKQGDEESMKAYREKIQDPQQQYLTALRELSAARLTPEMRAFQAHQTWLNKMTVNSIAVSGNDVFLSCPMTKASGFAVWRTDLNFANPKRIIQNLAGCCGQMDIKVKNGEVWVAHNARHKVERYDRDGKKLSSFGKTDRINADGFGGCCEPKNLRFDAKGDLYACESGPPTCIKHFTADGEFLCVAAIAPWTSGCVRVTTEVNADASKFFMLHADENTIQVFTKKKAEAQTEKPGSAN